MLKDFGVFVILALFPLSPALFLSPLRCLVVTTVTCVEIRPDSDKEEMRCCVAGHAPPLNTFLNLICFSTPTTFLLFFREKLKMKEREEAWVKMKIQ